MFESAKRGGAAFLGCVAGWVIVAGVAGAAQTGDATRLAGAQRFVRAFYPTLQGKHLETDVTVHSDYDTIWQDTGGLSIVVHPPDHNQESQSLLTVFLTVSMDGILLSQARGSHVSYQKWTELGTQVKEHPDWTDEDLEAAMKRGGARFPQSAREAFVQALDVPSLEHILGTVRRSDVRFVWRLPFDERQPATPAWVVKLETDRQGASRCYSMTFEPFTGRLLFLSTGAGCGG